MHFLFCAAVNIRGHRVMTLCRAWLIVFVTPFATDGLITGAIKFHAIINNKL